MNKMMNNQGKSYDNIAEGFPKMRDSFNIEKDFQVTGIDGS